MPATPPPCLVGEDTADSAELLADIVGYSQPARAANG